MKILNFDKLQSPKFYSFKDMTGFSRLNYENTNLQKDIRNSRCLIIDSSLFHSNQMKTRKIDHSVNTVVCISLEMRSIASQPSVAVGWVKIKVWSMPHLKGLTANFKLM